MNESGEGTFQSKPLDFTSLAHPFVTGVFPPRLFSNSTGRDSSGSEALHSWDPGHCSCQFPWEALWSDLTAVLSRRVGPRCYEISIDFVHRRPLLNFLHKWVCPKIVCLAQGANRVSIYIYIYIRYILLYYIIYIYIYNYIYIYRILFWTNPNGSSEMAHKQLTLRSAWAWRRQTGSQDRVEERKLRTEAAGNTVCYRISYRI